MGHIENILKRKSVRHYDSKSLSESIENQVKTWIQQVDQGPFKTLPRIEALQVNDVAVADQKSFASYGMIKGAKHYLVAVSGKEKQDLIDLGYQLEKLILKLTEINLGTCWMAGTFNRVKIEALFSKTFKMAENQQVSILVPFGNPAQKLRFFDKVIKAVSHSDKRNPLEQLFFNPKGEPARVDLSSWWGKGLHAVQMAPSARNAQPWRVVVSEDHQSFHFYIKGESYVDIGIAMAHFELAAEAYDVKGAWANQEDKSILEGAEYILTWKQL